LLASTSLPRLPDQRAMKNWLLVLISTFLLNHFDLFGLRQVYLFLIGRPYTPVKFGTPILYRHVRHPLYLGWLFAFWATPTMSVPHLFFAIATTLYIFMAIQFEERDLTRLFGDEYRRYQKSVPMILPLRFGKSEVRSQRSEVRGQKSEVRRTTDHGLLTTDY
jgi:hypothetical protein